VKTWREICFSVKHMTSYEKRVSDKEETRGKERSDLLFKGNGQCLQGIQQSRFWRFIPEICLGRGDGKGGGARVKGGIRD